MSELVGFEKLKKDTGITSPIKLEQCLSAQGIVYFRGGSKSNPTIFTTTGLIDAAGGLTSSSERTEPADKHF